MQPVPEPASRSEADARGGEAAGHRETILLLTQALTARISAMTAGAPPPGWWFTPSGYFTEP
jgi:hypothetical protein